MRVMVFYEGRRLFVVDVSHDPEGIPFVDCPVPTLELLVQVERWLLGHETAAGWSFVILPERSPPSYRED